MKKLSANVCAVTHTGRVRKENEDNYSLNGRLTSDGGLKKGSAYVQKMTEPFHLAVCDGMGGESYGEIASGIAVEAIAKHASDIYTSGEDFSFAISNTLDDANTKICREITERGARMGTTLAAVYVVKGKVICTSMGDTRIYHFSNGLLEQATFDHTHAQGIVDAGVVPADEIKSIPDAKRLTKHLGVFPEEAALQPNISVIDDVENNDVILLCSDGLTDMLSDDEISAIVSAGDSPQDVSGKLIRKALEKGGKDNVTVVTAFMSAEDTAVFVPIAEAMVGDKEPDYEEEYRSSFGAQQPVGQTPVSPYANADARAYEKPVDKKKILMIAGIVAAAIVVLVLAVVIIKAAMGGSKEEVTTTSNYYTVAPTETTSEIVVWTTESTTEETTTEESTEESSTETTTRRVTTTTPRTGTTRGTNPYATTTRRYTTTTKKTTTTTKKVTTTSSKTTTSTTAKDDSTTATGDSTSAKDDSTTAKSDTTSSKDETTTKESETTAAAAESTSDSGSSSGSSTGGVEPQSAQS